jgi:ArsR family transcriptional regulator
MSCPILGDVPTRPALLPLLPVHDTVACCEPLVHEVLAADQAERLARVLKAIADPARLRLLSLVAAQESGELCTCDATDRLGLTQPTVSHHFKVLVAAGLLARDKRGVWAYYALVPGALDALAGLLATTGSAR